MAGRVAVRTDLIFSQKKAKEAAEGNQSMLKKWTKDILAIDDDVDSNNNGLDVTQDVPDLKLWFDIDNDKETLFEGICDKMQLIT